MGCSKATKRRVLTFGLEVLSWVCVAFRLFVRFGVMKAPGWDDLFVVLSLV